MNGEARGEGANRLLIGTRAFCSMLLGWSLFASYLAYEVLSAAHVRPDHFALGITIVAMSFAFCLPVILMFSVIALIAAESIARFTTRWSVMAGVAGTGIFYVLTKDTRGALPVLSVLSPLSAAAVFWLWMKRADQES